MNFINTPRPVPDSFTSSIVGGGTAFLLLNLANFSPYLLLLLNLFKAESNIFTICQATSPRCF